MKEGYAFFTDELGKITQKLFKNDRMVKESKTEKVEEKKDDKKSPDKKRNSQM